MSEVTKSTSSDVMEVRLWSYANFYRYRYGYSGYNGVVFIDEPKPKEPEFNEWGEICP